MNVDRTGKRIVGGKRYLFDGSILFGPGNTEQGTLRYDRHRRMWMFVADDGNEHLAVFDIEAEWNGKWYGYTYVYKYYERIKDVE